MPVNAIGQLYTFSIEASQDERLQKWIVIKVKKGQTVQKIAALRGHPEDARAIADENGIRSVKSKLSRKELRVPGELSVFLHVLAGDEGPEIVSGFPKIGILDRPERVGLTTFEGYDPIIMELPIRFEKLGDYGGYEIERDIELLERMAHRGNFGGAGVGPPPLIRVTSEKSGEIVPLIPHNYQWSNGNPSAPVWRISGLSLPRDSGSRRVNVHGSLTPWTSRTRSPTSASRTRSSARRPSTSRCTTLAGRWSGRGSGT
jgi:hypothetical protein